MGKSDLPARRHAEVSRPAAFLSEGRRMPVERSSQFARPEKRYRHKNACWLKFMVAGFSCGALVAFSAPALAFRPFDGTDAEVAELNHFDIELQPFGALQEGPDKKLVAPETVINYGFTKDWEAVLQGQLESRIFPLGQESLTDAGFFLKHIFREGSLQEGSGPSIAAEFGLLVPSLGINSAVGPSWDWIISQRYPWGTLHLNVQGSLASDQRADLFLDLILEGPSTWTVRPVAEIFSNTEFHGVQTYSGLIGGIWKISEDLSVDFALRHAISTDHSSNELRLGLTYSFPLDRSHEALPDSAKMSRQSR
jgi:hypothetical protein